MRILASKNRDSLLALLAERLAFERLGVRLYDAVIDKVKRATDLSFAGELLLPLVKAREEELEHATWLDARLRELGADPAAPTEAARLAELESRGLFELILSPGESLARTFHALLGAELLDHAGWHVLVQLADEAHDEEARLEFRRRIWEEDEHLELARSIVQSFAREEVLGKKVKPQAA